MQFSQGPKYCGPSVGVMLVRFPPLFHRNNCMLGLKPNKTGRIDIVLLMYSVEVMWPLCSLGEI